MKRGAERRLCSVYTCALLPRRKSHWPRLFRRDSQSQGATTQPSLIPSSPANESAPAAYVTVCPTLNPPSWTRSSVRAVTNEVRAATPPSSPRSAAISSPGLTVRPIPAHSEKDGRSANRRPPIRPFASARPNPGSGPSPPARPRGALSPPSLCVSRRRRRRPPRERKGSARSAATQSSPLPPEGSLRRSRRRRGAAGAGPRGRHGYRSECHAAG